MAEIQHVRDEISAAALADLLNGRQRRRPVVVVTIPAGRTDPWIDAEEVARETGDLADVYLMPTGPFTWAFSNRMADGTQVYGGAGRVYPVGHEWFADLSKSPLRFAFNVADGQRATQNLISDALRMAAAAGLLRALPSREVRQVTGAVKMVIAGRALVDIGTLMPAAIAEELTVADVSIDRIVKAGQDVEGWFDRETNRLDVTKSLRPSTEALQGYTAGDVVLTRVVKVRNGKAELLLYPQTTTRPVIVSVLRTEVTDNPADDLRTLMTVGEVIPARVVTGHPTWTLKLSDVDDDEPIVEPPSVLPGGPPWIIEEPDSDEASEPIGHTPTLLPAPSPSPELELELEQPSRPEPASPPHTARPSPTLLDRNRPTPAIPKPTGPSPAPLTTESTRALLLKIDGLQAEIARHQREESGLRADLLAAAHDRDQLRFLLDQAEGRANKAEHDLKSARSRLRKSGNTKPSLRAAGAPQFADPEQGFRYLVLTAWATRTAVGEQHARRLPGYDLGPGFLESLRKLEGIKAEKVADVVFEIVTGLAAQLPGREVHRLRTGPGGDNPVRSREDGAVAWRSSLQVNTPSARRIHYWMLPDGRFEFARVATHDDFSV